MSVFFWQSGEPYGNDGCGIVAKESCLARAHGGQFSRCVPRFRFSYKITVTGWNPNSPTPVQMANTSMQDEEEI
eukprot:scaffold157484_cov42-Attheya_sp.AAC.1